MGPREKLRKWRGERTYREAADVLGCDASYVRYIEIGKRKPGRDLAERIRIEVGVQPPEWSGKARERRAS